MYPGHAGGGVLRLHATYRHDLKIKASDEGRVMKTAAAFTKGLLELEGQLTPILVSLVSVEEKSRQMLDKGGDDAIKEEMDRCKQHLDVIQMEESIDETSGQLKEEVLQTISGSKNSSVRQGLLRLGNPREALRRIHSLIGGICNQLAELSSQDLDSEAESSESRPQTPSTEGVSHTSETTIVASEMVGSSAGTTVEKVQTSRPATLLLTESVDLMLERWEKINKDFWDMKRNQYDLTKVPDVYDMCKYDVLHNHQLGLEGMEELFHLSLALADCVVPQEYGINESDKRIIGSKLCGALLEKIKYDLMVVQDQVDDMHYLLDHSHAEDLSINSLSRCVRSRLYFTSESHLHTILNVLRYPAEGQLSPITEEGIKHIEMSPELGYLTQIVIRVFENVNDPSKFRCEILFSTGATNDPLVDKSANLAPYVALNPNISCDRMIECLEQAIMAGIDDHDEEPHAEMDDSLLSELSISEEMNSDGKQRQTEDHRVSGQHQNNVRDAIMYDTLTPVYLTHPQARQTEERLYLDKNTFVAPNGISPSTRHYHPHLHHPSNITVVSGSMAASDSWEFSATSSDKRRVTSASLRALKRLSSSPRRGQSCDEKDYYRSRRNSEPPQNPFPGTIRDASALILDMTEEEAGQVSMLAKPAPDFVRGSFDDA